MRRSVRVGVSVLFLVFVGVTADAGSRAADNPRTSGLWAGSKGLVVWIQSRIVWPWPTPPVEEEPSKISPPLPAPDQGTDSRIVPPLPAPDEREASRIVPPWPAP